MSKLSEKWETQWKTLGALQQRLVTALILGAAFLIVLLIGGWLFTIVLILAGILAYSEFLLLAETPTEKYLGIAYVFIPVLCLIWLRHTTYVPVLMVMVTVIMTDTGAYFTGRKLGGPKLAPKISPNKTWSGLGGGVVAAAFGLWFLALIYHAQPLSHYFVLGAALAVIAQTGDLFESFLKRRAGVKDSGTIIPGHGGLLDRIDGLLTAAPFFAFFIWLTT
jgi:phosphatidate cytidylyltransferase